ncbi:HK97 family phage prohead protease [Gordonia sp. HS-NH1]|uniref:HK97 family phage prohead protease n=1 Tax=Gordonia sp. HS-NH1 TaxID=1435068 RepID=UPI000A918D76|nr:HK97 family phage prohead protease [Gordonia sp. HS-NH1]
MLKHKTVTMTGIKTAGLADGEFIGWASTFGNTDSQGDRVVKGAFATSVKSIEGGDVVPILWEHKHDDPRMQVGEIKSAEETDDGLKVHVALDLDTETGRAAYKSVKSRRVKAMSIGYATRRAVKAADGVQELTDLDLVEVSLVARPANDQALITASKSGNGAAAIVAARAALAKASGDTSADDEKPEKFYDDEATDKTHGERLLDALAAATASAEALIKEAEDEGRDLTEEEAAEVTKRLEYLRMTKTQIQAWADATPGERHGIQHQYDVISSKSLTPAEFEQRWGTTDTAADKFGHFDATSVGITTSTKAKEAPTVDTTTKFIALGSGRKAAASAIATKMSGGGHRAPGDDAPTGTKALTTSGQVTTDIPVAPTVIPTGRPAVSLLDVIPTVRRTGPQYRYIRQVSRALNAAAVAPGAEKPTSTMGTETVDGNVSVVAHLSEPLDKFVLADAPQLQRFVADELLYGLDVAIQAQALTGSGTGANQTGILNTSGVQVQAFDTSAIVSIRKAMTKAEANGYVPGVAVLRPEDWESIELTATSDDAVAFRGVPIDLLERKLWGLRVVLNTALPAKTGLVLDPAAVSIDNLGGIDIEWSTEAGDLFAHNQVQARVETRIGVSVYAPAAVYKVATAA